MNTYPVAGLHVLLVGADKLCFFSYLLFYSSILNFLAYYSFLKCQYSFFITYYALKNVLENSENECEIHVLTNNNKTNSLNDYA